MNGNTVLITGISGFIANHCAVELLNAGYRVRGSLRSLGRAGQVKDILARHADVTNLELAEADLESDAGWEEAVAGCTHVLHVASPFPVSQPKDEQVLIRPAVEGTLRVLRAARAAGVERFVQTSSMAAVQYGHPHDRTAPFTEADWTVVDAPGVTPYAKSKTLAEWWALLGRRPVSVDGRDRESHQITTRRCGEEGPVAGVAQLGGQARRAFRSEGAADRSRARPRGSRGQHAHARDASDDVHTRDRSGGGHGPEPHRAEGGLVTNGPKDLTEVWRKR